MQDLINHIRQLKINSIAMPPLGCGNGGLDWAEVKPLIENYFAQLTDVTVYLFEPNENACPTKLEVNTAPLKMTPGRAAILALLETYQKFNYGLSKIEVQKLVYFLQEAGEDLKLNFVKHKYGPYADSLRNALNTMDGHYIEGVGDGVVESEISPNKDAMAEAKLYLANSESDIQTKVDRVSELIEGFQSPFGMELLASVHWVAKNEDARDCDQAFDRLQHWNPRKKIIMQTHHVEAAWKQLDQLGWF